MAPDGGRLARATHVRRTPLAVGQLRRDPQKPGRIVRVLYVSETYTHAPTRVDRGSSAEALRALSARRQARALVQALPKDDRSPPRVTRAAVSLECWPLVRTSDLTPAERAALARLQEDT